MKLSELERSTWFKDFILLVQRAHQGQIKQKKLLFIQCYISHNSNRHRIFKQCNERCFAMYFKVLITIDLVSAPNMVNTPVPWVGTFLKIIEGGPRNLRFIQINHFDGDFFVELLVKPENKIVWQCDIWYIKWASEEQV